MFRRNIIVSPEHGPLTPNMHHSLRVNYKSWSVVQKYVVSLHSGPTGGPHTMHKCKSGSFKVQSSQATPLSFSPSLPFLFCLLSLVGCQEAEGYSASAEGG